jgi:hypothetical protein
MQAFRFVLMSAVRRCTLAFCQSDTPISQNNAPRVARFFLVQYTKTVKIYLPKWPQNIANDHKMHQMTTKSYHKIYHKISTTKSTKSPKYKPNVCQ